MYIFRITIDIIRHIFRKSSKSYRGTVYVYELYLSKYENICNRRKLFREALLSPMSDSVELSQIYILMIPHIKHENFDIVSSFTEYDA